MKFLNSSIIRAIVAIISGALLFQYQTDMLKTLTQIIGVLFFLSGVVSIAVYYVNHKKEQQEGEPRKEIAGEAVPFVGLGSCTLGGILFFSPDTFDEWLKIIFAALIILGAIGEFIGLIKGEVSIKKNWVFWICPALLLIFGILAIATPSIFGEENKILTYLATALIIYGISEIACTFKIRSIRKKEARESLKEMVQNDADIAEAEIVEDNE